MGKTFQRFPHSFWAIVFLVLETLADLIRCIRTEFVQIKMLYKTLQKGLTVSLNWH